VSAPVAVPERRTLEAVSPERGAPREEHVHEKQAEREQAAAVVGSMLWLLLGSVS
jgi:hypothetical protein